MAALCGPGCGYCGGCTAAYEREDDRRVRRCDHCGDDCGRETVRTAAGVFCSRQCLNDDAVLRATPVVDDGEGFCDVCDQPLGVDRVLVTVGRFCSAGCLDEAASLEA